MNAIKYIAGSSAIKRIAITGVISSSVLLYHGPYATIRNPIKRDGMGKLIGDYFRYADDLIRQFRDKPPRIRPSPEGFIGAMQVSEHLKKLIDEVLDEKLKQLDDTQKKLIRFDTYNNLNSWLASSTKCPICIVNILLPDYLNVQNSKELRAKSINELLKKKFKITLENEEWLTNDGLNIINSFLLSEKAKKYLIAYTINQADNGYIYCRFIIAWMFLYLYAALMKAHFGKRVFAQANNRIMAIATAGLVATTYLFSTLILNINRDRNADAKALTKGLYHHGILTKSVSEKKPIELDNEMLEGAKELLLKQELRNKAIYNISKKRSGVFFWLKRYPRIKSNGDEYNRLKPHLSISERLQCIRQWTGEIPSNDILMKMFTNETTFTRKPGE